MMEKRSFDASHPAVHVNPALRKHTPHDDNVVMLNGSKVQISPPRATGESVAAAPTVTAGSRWSDFWRAVLEFSIEGFALYGATIHPTDYVISDYRARYDTRLTRKEVASEDPPVDDTH